MATEGVWQWKNRTTVYYTDQHGRKYEGQQDNTSVRHWRAEAPLPVWVGSLIPKFRAPIMPPAEFVKPAPNELTGVRVDYDAWDAALIEGEASRRQFIGQIARALHPANALEIIQNPTPEVVMMAGDEPLPRLLVHAMRRGNPYLLGFSDEVPEWLTAQHQEAIDRAAGRLSASVRAQSVEEFDRIIGGTGDDTKPRRGRGRPSQELATA